MPIRTPGLERTPDSSRLSLDIILAKLKALIGFAGPKMIAQSVRVQLPEGFSQTSEILIQHDFLDRIVHRNELRGLLAQLIDDVLPGNAIFLTPACETRRSGLAYVGWSGLRDRPSRPTVASSMSITPDDANPPDATLDVNRSQTETTFRVSDDVGSPTLTSASPHGEGRGEVTVDSSVSMNPRAILATPSIPGYKILRELGRGGMGVVYQAINHSMDRSVALKMILAGDYASSESLARFRTESLAIAKVQHRNVVQIHHVGEHAGWPYYEMEFVAGGSLAESLLGEPYPPRKAAMIVNQLASGTAEAHRLGIIHRDLKPSNILLDEQGLPKIADFGLAKILGGTSGTTRTELIMGTPSYMAPEQADGRAGEVGAAADIHALGAILYELLTGRPPFRGATLLETLEQVKHTEPVSPSRLVPTVSRDLETICLTCLRKDPASRYPSATAVGEDLGRFLAGQSILARRTSSARRVWLWSRRNPTVAGLSAIAVGLLFALAAGSTIAAARLRHERTLVEAAEVLRKADLARSLLTASPDSVPFIVNSLGSARGPARSLLRLECDDVKAGEDRRVRAAAVLTILEEDRSPFLIERIERIAGAEANNIHRALAAAPRERCLAALLSAFELAASKESRARLAATLLDMGDARATLSMLTMAPDPSDRIAFIRGFTTWHGDLVAAPDWLRRGSPDMRSGLLVALGLSVPDRLSAAWPPLLETVRDLYREAPDGGTHSAAGWALRQWHAEVSPIAASLTVEGVGWFIDHHGLTMIETPPGLLTIVDLPQGTRRRGFAMTHSTYLSDAEIPERIYRQFLDDPEADRPIESSILKQDLPRTGDHPMSSVSWNDAILFCNWLSRAEGRTPCYTRDENTAKGWQCRYDRDGYRLPTSAEWEFACRAGSEKLYATGDRPEALTLFANTLTNGTDRVCDKAPNPFGFFDMNGNLWEWLGDAPNPDKVRSNAISIDPVEFQTMGNLHALSGGAFDSGSNDFRLGRLIWPNVGERTYSMGFRVAITGREDDRTPRVVESIEALASGIAADPKASIDAAFIMGTLGLWHAFRSEDAKAKESYARAADHFSLAVESDPFALNLQYCHILMLALKGDHEAYRISCDRMLESIGPPYNSNTTMQVARACGLLASPASLEIPSRIAKSSVAEFPDRPWLRYVLGLMEYRSGRYQEAIDELTQSEKLGKWNAAMLNWPILAMAHHRLGHQPEAEQLLDRSRAFRKTLGDGGSIGGPNQYIVWFDLAEFLLMLDEAEKLFHGSLPKPPQ